ncbi:hypothetical protein K440DRAFT_643174 [Wilcoxina mikolae CBS 423.85]|nr:hypothetical protein K440DRAFT_643174 [Wilcoxina mikolae CBS 423.85]
MIHDTLTHASTLQIRKSLESSILESLVYLVDFPFSKPLPPGPTEILSFKHHLRFFTPGDYDDLTEERNIVARCGYPLCGNLKKSTGKSRLARIASGEWVERKTVERFCSEGCARRALWVRVQLSVEPAWVREEVVGGAEVDPETGRVSGVDLDSVEPEEGWEAGLRLFEEAEEARKGGGVWRDKDDGDVRRLAEELQGIGIKDAGLKGKEKKGAVLADVKEREVGEKVVVTLPGEDGDTAAIEGYVPKASRTNE